MKTINFPHDAFTFIHRKLYLSTEMPLWCYIALRLERDCTGITSLAIKRAFIDELVHAPMFLFSVMNMKQPNGRIPALVKRKLSLEVGEGCQSSVHVYKNSVAIICVFIIPRTGDIVFTLSVCLSVCPSVCLSVCPSETLCAEFCAANSS